MSELEYNLPEKGEPSGVADGKIKTALSQIKETVNGKLDSVNLKNEGVETADIKNGAVTSTKLATGLGRITWYTPKIIATEETRENVAFGFLTTEDKIENVVLPENGLILIGYQALWKNSVAGAGKAAIFIGSNQLTYAKPTGGGSAEATCTASTASFTPLTTSSTPYETGVGLISPASGGGAVNVTTGQILGWANGSSSVGGGGSIEVFAAAGTYTIGVKYKATSGNVTAKERKLWVATLG